jgi:hypothetical protein
LAENRRANPAVEANTVPEPACRKYWESAVLGDGGLLDSNESREK